MDKTIRILDESQGEFIGVAGDNYRVIVGAEATENACSVIDMTIPPGGGPVPHAHPDIQEWFYVLEGELEYKTEAGAAIVGKGGFVYIPRGGAIHSFKNLTHEMARVLCVVMPGGLERFFAEFGVPVTRGEFPPPLVMTPELQARLDALNEKYGQTMYEPDYLD
jgi:quercetin dioxygenase-like cupin family protein